MKYSNVCIESFGYTIPDEIWTSDDIEKRLKPLYERLKLPEGRLELMTGIRERRFWPVELRPSHLSVPSCNRAIEAAEIDRNKIGCLIHGSVCRDFLEPATACSVHHHVGLREDCVIYDVSNACLGIMNGMVQAANMIELGQVEAALVVGSEGGRQLVEKTIQTLNKDTSLTRKSIKNAIASLTIGSASCAVLMTHRDISKTGNQMLNAQVVANTKFHDLCQSDQDQAGSSMQPLMATDSNELMTQGVKTGVETFNKFVKELEWTSADIDCSFSHQVGSAHRKLMLEGMGLPEKIDYTTFEWLGNTGSAALPITMAHGLENGVVDEGNNVAMLGIGSGINCLMIGASWQQSRVSGGTFSESSVVI